MGYILLFILCIWLVPKLIRGFMFVHRVKKQTRTIFDQMYGNGANPQQRERKRSRSGWSSPTQRAKKIDPNVGEYVKFQEITVTEQTETRTDNNTSQTHYTVEQQVTDAEWEDIK